MPFLSEPNLRLFCHFTTFEPTFLPDIFESWTCLQWYLHVSIKSQFCTTTTCWAYTCSEKGSQNKNISYCNFNTHISWYASSFPIFQLTRNYQVFDFVLILLKFFPNFVTKLKMSIHLYIKVSARFSKDWSHQQVGSRRKWWKIKEIAYSTRFKACQWNFKTIAAGWQLENGANLSRRNQCKIKANAWLKTNMQVGKKLWLAQAGIQIPPTHRGRNIYPKGWIIQQSSQKFS